MVPVYDPATQQVAPRRIEVGLNNNVMAEVLSGLEEGEQVVSGNVAVPGGQQGQQGGGNFRMGGGMMMMGGPRGGG